jgi:hypothetical protein
MRDADVWVKLSKKAVRKERTGLGEKRRRRRRAGQTLEQETNEELSCFGRD